MPKILHTGDLHINALRRFRSSYLKRMEETLNLIEIVAAHHNVDYIVVAGDVFERLDVLHEERLLFTKWISTLDVPVIVISGNHDKRTDEMGDTLLAYLSGLDFEKGHVIHGSWPEAVHFEDCTFVLIPFNKWTDHEFFLVLDVTIPQAVKEAQGNPIIVVMHEETVGCKYDNDMTTKRSDAIHFDPSLLKRFSGVTYWALGHMHTHQRIADNVWYAGAPHQTKFGETEEKGILLVDTDNPTEPEFVDLEAMPLVQVDKTPDSFDGEAIYSFVPDGPIPSSLHIPDNVEIKSKLPVESEAMDPSEGMVDILYGLESALQRVGLRADLSPMAVKLAEEALARLQGRELPTKKRRRRKRKK